MYMWSGCIGNLSDLGAGGADGHGAGPMTYNGLSINDAFWTFPTFPEVLQAAGVSWKIYQDLAGPPGPPFFGDGEGFGNAFTGNFADGTLLYFNQYGTAAPGSPLFENAATGTDLLSTIPGSGAPKQDWLNWAEHLFDNFRKDVHTVSCLRFPGSPHPPVIPNTQTGRSITARGTWRTFSTF